MNIILIFKFVICFSNSLDLFFIKDVIIKKAKKTKEIKDAIKMVEMQVDEVSDLIDGIEARLNEAKGDSILNDFRQINNILKLRE